MDMRITHLLAIVLSLFFVTKLSAQWEWERATFSNLDFGYELDGIITLDNDAKNDWIISVEVQADGKTLLLGGSRDTTAEYVLNHILIRIDIDGSLDKDFGQDGKVHLPSDYFSPRTYLKDIDALTLQADGKIVIVGGIGAHPHTSKGTMLLRYTSDGRLDNSFGEEGILLLDSQTNNSCYTICQQADGKLVIAGTSGSFNHEDFFLVRLTADGQIDRTFGNLGYVHTDLGKNESTSKVLYQRDGKLLIIGFAHEDYEKSDFAIARYLPNGTLDESFGNKGKIITKIGSGGAAWATDAILQKDGKILVAGYAEGAYQSDYAMVRYHVDGQLDKSFGNKGKVIKSISPLGDRGASIVIQEDDKIILAGNSEEWASHITLVRFHSDGRLDYSFGDRGKQMPYFGVHGSTVNTIQLRDNKILLAGNVRLATEQTHDFLLIRVLSDFNVGTIDFALNTKEVLVYPNPIEQTATLEYTLDQTEALTIELVDLYGRILATYQQNKRQAKGTYQQQIDLPTQLPTGVYLLRIHSTNGQMSIKIRK